MRPRKCPIRPYKALYGLIRPYKASYGLITPHKALSALIPPFLLESIIPVPEGFLPLSRFFWQGIIWTPEMRGKGVPKMGSIFVFFLLVVLAPKIAPKFVQILIIFGSNFGPLFLESWSSLGVFWEPSWAS